MELPQSHWDSDAVAGLYPRLARWLPLGFAAVLVGTAILSGSAGSAAFLLAFALLVGGFGVFYAQRVRALDAVDLTPDHLALVLSGSGRTETIVLSRVRHVQFGKYGAIITIVTASPSRQYLISLLDQPRLSLREALSAAGLFVSGH